MAFYPLTKTQKFPLSVLEIWDFISSLINLNEKTLKHMSLKITRNASSEKMYPSMIITYKGSSLLGFKRDCLSSINQVRVYEYIAVEQRIVNYKMWHQQHQLEQIENGVLIDDTITYPIPIGFLGAVMNSLLIKKQLQQIFDNRTIASENQFDKFNS